MVHFYVTIRSCMSIKCIGLQLCVIMRNLCGQIKSPLLYQLSYEHSMTYDFCKVTVVSRFTSSRFQRCNGHSAAGIV